MFFVTILIKNTACRITPIYIYRLEAVELVAVELVAVELGAVELAAVELAA